MSEISTPPLTMDIKAAAQRLGCSLDWLRTQAREGRVPHVLMGRTRRFTEANLEAILTQREQAAADPWVRSARSQAARNRRPRSA